MLTAGMILLSLLIYSYFLAEKFYVTGYSQGQEDMLKLIQGLYTAKQDLEKKQDEN